MRTQRRWSLLWQKSEKVKVGSVGGPGGVTNYEVTKTGTKGYEYDVTIQGTNPSSLERNEEGRVSGTGSFGPSRPARPFLFIK